MNRKKRNNTKKNKQDLVLSQQNANYGCSRPYSRHIRNRSVYGKKSPHGFPWKLSCAVYFHPHFFITALLHPLALPIESIEYRRIPTTYTQGLTSPFRQVMMQRMNVPSSITEQDLQMRIPRNLLQIQKEKQVCSDSCLHVR